MDSKRGFQPGDDDKKHKRPLIGVEDNKKEKADNVGNISNVIDCMSILSHMFIKNKNNLTETALNTRSNKKEHDLFNKSNKIMTSNILNIGTGLEKFQENKFSIRQVLDKSQNQETYQKSFFVLSEDLNEEHEEMSSKLKRDFVLKRIISDRKIISNKLIPERFNRDVKPNEKSEIDIFNEKMICEIYSGMSAESREFQLENNNIDENTLTFFQTLMNINNENLLKNSEISNDIILNLCGNIIKVEDLFDKPLVEITGENNDEEEQLKQKKAENELSELENKYDNKKSRRLSILDIPGSVLPEDKYNDNGIYLLLEYLKNAKDKPVTEKMEKLLDVFANNKLDNKNINIDNNLKEMLLKNLKDEFIREKEQLSQQKSSANNLKNFKDELPHKNFNFHSDSQENIHKDSKFYQEKVTRKKESPTKNFVSKPSNLNNKVENSNILTSESEYDIKNPFIDSLHNNKKHVQQPNKKKEMVTIKENLLSKVVYTNSGWGVNKNSNVGIKTQSKTNFSHNQIKTNYLKNKASDESEEWIRYK